MKPRTPSSAGFSLVEVAIALAVASFCLITIAGLLSVGLSSSQTSTQETVMSNIASQVASDLRATPLGTANGNSLVSPFYGISLANTSSTMTSPTQLLVMADGQKATDKTTAAFSVWVGVAPPSSGVGATMVRILVTWPAQAAPNFDSTGWPTGFSGSYGTVLALNRN